MPKTKISEYSATANSNTDVASINIDEGCAPSGINNAIRAIMGHLKDFQSGTSNDPFTIGSSGSLTLSYGTANGVAYLNGSKAVTSGSALTFDGTNFATTGTASATKMIPTGGSATGNGMYLPASNTLAWSNNGSETMRLDSAGNLGLGVTPSAWGGSFKALQIGLGTSLYNNASGNGTFLGSNFYWDGTNNKYLNTNTATAYGQSAGAHQWYTAASGTAGNAITFTQAMTLDASGDLGIGTTSPDTKLNTEGGSLRVSGTRTAGSFLDVAPSNTGTDGVALSVSYYGSGNYGPLKFTTGGSERARIDSSGNLLVGATSGSGLGSSKIYVLTNNQNGIISQQSVTGSYCYLSNALSNGGTYYHFQFNENGTQRGLISSNGSATTYGTSSDYRLKENIAPMTGALSTVAQLKPCTYTWKESGITSQGFIAHELQAIVPDAVVGEKDAVNEDGSIKPQSIDTSFLVATLTAAIQEQQALITQLQADVAALKGA